MYNITYNSLRPYLFKNKSTFLFWICMTLLLILFSKPLYSLTLLSMNEEIHSYVLLIPLVSLYLVNLKRSSMPEISHVNSWSILTMISVLAFIFFGLSSLSSKNLNNNDVISLLVICYILLNVAICVLFYGYARFRHLAFPFAFLFFMVPLPDLLVSRLEDLLMRASRDVAYLFFHCTNTPVLRNGQILELPGTALEVARECSGIRSTLILFITSIIASHLFLTSITHRIIIILIIIPLGIIRNSARILVIGLLCVYNGPHIIDSWIHHNGGIVFFVLSLIPLFMIGAFLYYREKKTRTPIYSTTSIPFQKHEHIDPSRNEN